MDNGRFQSAGELFEWLSASYTNVVYHDKARHRIYKGHFQAKDGPEEDWENTDERLTETLATFGKAVKLSALHGDVDALLEIICEDNCKGAEITQLIKLIVDRLPPEKPLKKLATVPKVRARKTRRN